MINFDQIDNGVFIGSAPVNDLDISRLNKLKISAVVSLQSDIDHKVHRIHWRTLVDTYKKHNIEVFRFPILDFDERDLAKNLPGAVLKLGELLGQNQRVYIHCNAGICRASATYLAYLCHFRDMSVNQGLHYIRRRRPQVNPYLSAVIDCLQALQRQ